jgi:putative colanic acid biosynthesis UDP-glucose lipid carrier transferase
MAAIVGGVTPSRPVERAEADQRRDLVDDAPPLSAMPTDRSMRSLPLAAGFRARLVAVLAIVDVSAALAALLWVAPIVKGHAWAVLLAGLGAAACLQAVGNGFGIYNVRTIRQLRRDVLTVMWLGLTALAIVVLGFFGVAGPDAASRIAPVGFAALLVPVALRLAVAAWLDRHAASVAERVVLIGTPKATDDLLAIIRPAAARERVVGVIAIGAGRSGGMDVLAELDPLRRDADAMVEDFWRIADALRAHSKTIDRVVIAAAGLDDATLAATMGRLEHLPFEIALASPAVALAEAADPLDRTNCVVLRRAAITQGGQMCKRALDIVTAASLLIVLGPVLLIIAALIRLDSPGPALFRQARWGWNNEPFTVFKFRTMWSGAPGADGSVQATRGDRRITRFGAFLRSTSLDELPQLLNILNGTMSLVGPRPHPVELNLRYLGVIERYAVRHRVVPGITGLAQIHGHRGETPSPSAMQRRVDYDLEYIRTRSLGADLLIILRTVASVIRGVNAY